MRLAFAAVDGAPHRGRTVVVDHQVGMAARAVQPALDTLLRSCESRAHGSFSGLAVGVGGSAGDAAFPFHALAQLIISLPHVLAENVAAGGFILAEVASRANCRTVLTSLGRRRRQRGTCA